MRRILKMVLCAIVLTGVVFPAYAQETKAEEITASTAILGEQDDYSMLTDGIEYENVYVSSELILKNETGMAGLYLVFDLPCQYTIRDAQTGKTLSGGREGFLHCFSDLEGKFGYAPKEIAIHFPEGAWLGELRIFSSGALPDTVQRWQQPLTGGADMVLFSTHGDDEQLYFAGLLPYYAGERELDVQVVYMTNHSNLCGSLRQHEMLNGLWAVGVKAYPIFGPFPDFKEPGMETTYREYENMGYSREELLRFVVENLRRFRPQVAVGHDLNGEYGHGMHKVYADLLTKAVEVSADPEMFPKSARQYGVWDVPKTYLHLYPENEIIMDWDQPLERFDGLTAFQVNQKLGFPCHVSQQYDLYVYWLYGPNNSQTLASEIASYSPCRYGLIRTTVGEDVDQNDLMENLTSYAEQSSQYDEKEQALLAMVEAEKLANAEEPKLLRPPVDPMTEKQENPRVFPVFAGLLAMLTLAGAGALAVKIKKFEKNENNT